MDSEAVECTSEELCETMYSMTHLELSDFSIKGKYIYSYIYTAS